MLKYILQDFRARKQSIIKIFFDRGLCAVFLYRLSSWCYQHKLRTAALLIKHLNIQLNSCDIAYQAQIGIGFRGYHAIGTVIANCTIGDNFSIYQNVTIGSSNRTDPSGRNTPIIGSNVSLTTGCVVIGPVIIGDYVKVGANAVVNKDIPSYSTAVGVPARIILRGDEKKRQLSK